jgi:imidazolonepropionase-like amidohydrolase
MGDTMRHSTKLWRHVPLAAAIAIVLAVPVLAQTTQPAPQRSLSPKATLAIVGGMLIDGRGAQPVQRSVILIDGKKIAAVGTVDTLKVPAGTKVIDAAGYTVMGGLTDAHVHLDFLGHADYVTFHKTFSAMGAVGERVAATSARQLLMAGVTTAVDLGGAPATQVHIRDRINRGELVGPRMKVSAGWIWNTTPEASAAHHRGMEGYLFNVHTPEEARAAILKTIALGADIVKNYTGLTAEQTKVVTEEAHKKGLKVTGHGEGDAKVLMKIANGQDAIEHNVSPDNPDLVQALVEHHTWVDPTPITQWAGIDAFRWPVLLDNPRFKALTPPEFYTPVRQSIEHPDKLAYFRGGMDPERITPQLKNIKKLYDADVRLLVGTDSGTPINFHTDSTRQEMELLVHAGIPPMKVLAMATKDAAEYLGLTDRLGTIEPGKLADIIVIDGNPLVDMGALQHVLYVLKEGVQYKGPGAAAAPTSTRTTSSK